MENYTANPMMNDTLYTPITQQPYWIISQTVNSILVVLDIFLIFSVGYFGYRTGRFTRTRSDQNGGTVLVVVFIATILMLPRLLINQTVILISLFHDNSYATEQCETAQDIANVSYGLAFLAVYFFLWIRQRLLYQQPSLSRLYNKVIKCLSWGCLVFLSLATLALVTIFVWPPLTKTSNQGCVFRAGSRTTSTAGRFAAPLVLMTGQLVLLSLFIYPLYKHKDVAIQSVSSQSNHSRAQTSSLSSCKRTRDLESVSSYPGSADESENEVFHSKTETSGRMTPTLNSTRKNRNGEALSQMVNKKSIRDKQQRRSARTARRINKVIKRTSVCVVVCIVCDLIANVTVGFMLPLQLPAMLINTVFDVNLMINVTALIVSFENYRRVFRSLCKCSVRSTSRLPSVSETSKSSTSH